MEGTASINRHRADQQKEKVIMQKLPIAGLFLVLTAFCLGQQSAPTQPVKVDPAIARIEELKSKAEHKGEADRGRIYADVARELVELANTQFINGESDKG